MIIAIVTLALINALQFYMINKLTNKLMSRNYQDYMMSHVVVEEAKQSRKEIRVPQEPEDIGSMAEFGVL